MRVHPGSISSHSRWQIPAALVVLSIILLIVLFRGPRESVVAIQSAPTEKRLDVVVARTKIEVGQPLKNADLVIEQRPITTLSSDVISNLDSVRGKVAAGPIPAGYPLALALLADPVAVLPPVEEQPAEIPSDPVEELLKAIESETVALPLAFSSVPPARGSRMAITMSNTRGESIVVAEDCWVAGVTGREAILRLDPARALLLQSAKSYGTFGFIEIATDGPSPYVGKAVNSLEELKARLEGKPAVAAPVVSKDERKMKGYAWVTGEGRRYGIDQDGEIKVLEGN